MSFTIALLIGMLVLLFYISTLFIFSMPLIAIENKGIFKSLQQSAALTWNHWWRTFSLQVTPFIVCIIVAAIIQIITKIPINFDFTIDQSLLISSSILRIVLYTVFVPWFACTLLLQLKDLELRKSLAQQRKTK
jgi:membrane-anchored glycerophosphoryl diester phosphodiesterase (GDPDase)